MSTVTGDATVLRRDSNEFERDDWA